MQTMIPIHVPCGKVMLELPGGGYYLRCVPCDSPPIQRSDSKLVRLERSNTEAAGQKEAAA
jgi:hypothetical protein